ncbi:MAG: extracellular solute-binding protein [Nocardioidaceae bacterium]|nr:extracellular solute-binding protein [Nocardioidaceae bacterium]MCL2613055.1 extracellular solute-binding protein [Nocardioidaceae bacterium]
MQRNPIRSLSGSSATGRGRRLSRALALSAAAALVLGMTAACGSGGSTSSKGITITTFGEFGYDALIKEWNKDHANDPSLQVTQKKVSQWDDWKAEINTDLQAGSGLPDVVAVEGDYEPALRTHPQPWVNLDQPAVKGRWLKYMSDDATTSNGQLIGYATDTGPEAICYNAALFKKAGLPTDRNAVAKLMTTWDAYFKLGEKFHKKIPNAAWYDASGSIAQAMLNQVRYPFGTENNKVDVTNPQLKNVYNTVVSHEDLSTKVPQWGADWTNDFKNGTVATVPCPGWMRANIKTNTGDPEPSNSSWDIADAFPGGAGNWGGSYLMIPKMSPHQKAAEQFITWITDPAQTARVFETVGNFPSQVGAYTNPTLLANKDSYFNDAPAGKIYSDRAKAIKMQPYHGPQYSDILQAFQNALNRVDTGTSASASWSTFLSDVKALQG